MVEIGLNVKLDNPLTAGTVSTPAPMNINIGKGIKIANAALGANYIAPLKANETGQITIDVGAGIQIQSGKLVATGLPAGAYLNDGTAPLSIKYVAQSETPPYLLDGQMAIWQDDNLYMRLIQKIGTQNHVVVFTKL